MNKTIFFSIIMPTYNSASTIDKALRSIHVQDLPQDEIEILVIDGGSTDQTLEIARKYGAIILNNPKRMPEYAKLIGFTQAKGRWVVMQDSDEVLIEKSQLRRRKEFLRKNPNVHCMLLDRYIPGEKCGIASAYINKMGDPFTYVVYGASESRVYENRSHLYDCSDVGNTYVYTDNDIIPIGDGGTTTIDINKAKELFGEEYYTQAFVVSAFYRMVQRTKYVGCIPGDNVYHYSEAGFKEYLQKLKFRVYTNLYDMKQAGYRSRAEYSDLLRKRKYLFVLYVVSFFAPVLDSIRMCVRYKRVAFLLHVVYTYYVAFQLTKGIVMKMLGMEWKETSYGKSQSASR